MNISEENRDFFIPGHKDKTTVYVYFRWDSSAVSC